MISQKRCRITITGIVQGVGFRPFVARLAASCRLDGWVANSGGKVIVEAQGSQAQINALIDRIIANPPSSAVIHRVEHIEIPCEDKRGFLIKASDTAPAVSSFLPPDIAICDDCIAEYHDKRDRRYQYPFISCTNCGPRYSIISQLPYDRAHTTMDAFALCESCTLEYQNPSNRRFHAQTNCCFACGPTIELWDTAGRRVNSPDPLETASKMLAEGKILAVKGIGGYHLCCDASSGSAVERLRLLKKRPHKPFAVMARDVDTLNKIAYISESERAVLNGKERPILLLNQKNSTIISGAVAPKQARIGVMLPYAPLQMGLFSEHCPLLVMTSANEKGVPIYHTEQQLQSFFGKVDGFLVHNRAILHPIDDAVVRVFQDKEMLVRLGRGYAPCSISLETPQTLLALGAEQKNSFSFTSDGQAVLSRYIGDLSQGEIYDDWVHELNEMQKLLGITPQALVCDKNPDYISTIFAQTALLPKEYVLHHHAHLASCIAENQLSKAVIGVVFDGTGLGDDGCIWGGELFYGTVAEMKRVGQLEYVKLQGGDSVVKHPARTAACYLSAMGIESAGLVDIDASLTQALNTALRQNLNCVNSSSIGRLFDCVAALLGFCHRISYEGQAAIELEAMIAAKEQEFYRFDITTTDGYVTLGYRQILDDLIADIRAGVTANRIATRFHNTLIHATANCVDTLSHIYDCRLVALSGGVFDNAYLLSGIVDVLEMRGFTVYHHSKVPTNDGGIALGQAAIRAKGKEHSNVSCNSGENSIT